MGENDVDDTGSATDPSPTRTATACWDLTGSPAGRDRAGSVGRTISCDLPRPGDHAPVRRARGQPPATGADRDVRPLCGARRVGGRVDARARRSGPNQLPVPRARRDRRSRSPLGVPPLLAGPRVRDRGDRRRQRLPAEHRDRGAPPARGRRRVGVRLSGGGSSGRCALRRRRDQRGRFPRGDELRRRVRHTDPLLLSQQRLGDLDPRVAPDR